MILKQEICIQKNLQVHKKHYEDLTSDFITILVMKQSEYKKLLLDTDTLMM